MINGIKYKWMIVALCVAITMAIVSTLFRPLWRDEYWALFFSDPDLNLNKLVSDRLVRDVHPPLYFYTIYKIRQLIDDTLLLRFLNLLWLATAGFAAWRLSSRPSRHLALFLFACFTSYWAIFFTAEVRPYAALYGLTIMLTVLTAELSLREGYTPGRLAVFALCGAAAGMLHYFAALFTAFCGLVMGLSWLARRRFGRFVLIGAVSVIAITPAALWIIFSFDQMTISGDSDEGALMRLEYGLEQLLRGILVKTFGSNLALTALAVAGASAAWRLQDRRAVVLVFAVVGAICVVFALHLAWAPLIKERAFIVFMPALIWLMVEAASRAPSGRVTKFLAAAIPIAAMFSPLLFVGEYLKDRERFSEVRAVYERYPSCQNASIYAYFRSYQHEDYYPYFTRMALTGGVPSPGLELVEAGLQNGAQIRPEEACPIAGVAIGLRRGDEALRDLARAAMLESGLDLSAMEERRLATGRHLIFLRDEGKLGELS